MHCMWRRHVLGLFDSGILSMGDVLFKADTRRAKASARFAVIQDSIQIERLCDLLEFDWALKRPSVLLSSMPRRWRTHVLR